MNQSNSSELIGLYDNWYSKAYMDDWPRWKKNRVKNIVSSLNLGKKGIALDLGCGSGVFTRVLKEALPDWEIHGTDISEIALKIGREKSTDIQYLSHFHCKNDSYDFVFTHHVLEHVEDIFTVVTDISRFAKANAKMLHIMPCGNSGSLEYYIASKSENGINKNKGNTFFFEEEMHLNRFTTDQIVGYFNKYNWSLKDSFYSNHFLGVFSWLSGMNTPYIMKTLNPKRVKNKPDKLKITLLRWFILFFYYLQRPYTYLKLRQLNKAWTGPLLRHPELTHKSVIGLTEILLFPSYFFVLLLNYLERIDWLLQKRNTNGGEMFLFFDR